MLTTKTLLVPLLVTGLGLLAPAPDETPAPGPDGLTVASDSLLVDFEGDLPLAGLLTAYSKATGVRVVMSPGVRERVQATTYAGFGGGLTLPPGELQGLVEGLLVREDFRLAMTHPGRVPVLTLLDTRRGQAHTDSPWLHVPVEETGHFSDNPALLIQTVVPCDEADARQMSNSLRILTNNQWSLVTSMGTENGIFVRGTGTEVARLVASIQRTNDFAAQGRVAREQQQAKEEQQAQARQVATELHIQPHLLPQAGGGMVVELETTITPPAERPELATEVFAIDRNFVDVVDMLKDLTYNRHVAEKQTDVWYSGERGELVPWPRPHFSYLRTQRRKDDLAAGKLVVQATTEDMAWITETLAMVSALSAGDAE